MRKIIITIIGIGILIGTSCKKEATTCPEPESPYKSTMEEKNGVVTVSIDSMSSNIDGSSCSGIFMREVGNNHVYSGFLIQVVEGWPDSLKMWENYHEKEFKVNIEFLGIGYSCLFLDPLGGPNFPTVNVELVRATYVEEVL